MTRFEYVSIFNGIIVALALENVAASFHKLFEAGARVRWHWMAPTNALGSATAALGTFWLAWVNRDVQPVNPTFLTFLPGALTSLLLYLLCAATLPDEVPEAGVDLKAFYFSTRRQFWSLGLALVLLSEGVAVWNIARAGFAPQVISAGVPFLIARAVAGALALSMIYVQRPWWHAIGISAVTAGVFFMFGPMKLV